MNNRYRVKRKVKVEHSELVASVVLYCVGVEAVETENVSTEGLRVELVVLGPVKGGEQRWLVKVPAGYPGSQTVSRTSLNRRGAWKVVLTNGKT